MKFGYNIKRNIPLIVKLPAESLNFGIEYLEIKLFLNMEVGFIILYTPWKSSSETIVHIGCREDGFILSQQASINRPLCVCQLKVHVTTGHASQGRFGVMAGLIVSIEKMN